MAPQTYDDILYWYRTFEQMLASNPQLAPIYEIFRSSEADRNNLEALNKIHFEARKKYYFRTNVVGNLLKCINAYQNQVLRIPNVGAKNTDQIELNLKELTKSGFTKLPALSTKKTREMFDYINVQPVHADPMKRNSSNLVAPDSIRTSKHVGILSEHSVTNCPHFLDIVLSPNILKVVEQYIGATPTLISLDSWRSFASGREAVEAQNFHVDLDDHKFVKLFIYLTDVDMQAGPHTYIPGSQNRQMIYDILAAYQDKNPEVGIWFTNQLRKTDEEVDKYIGIDPVYIEGKAGSCMLVDTSGLHKGLPPISSDRILLQATYGCTPTKTTHLEPLQVGTPGANNIKPETLTPPNDYIARYFVST